MKITINNCDECPYVYQNERFDTCSHPKTLGFDYDETPNFIPFNCPLREDPEMTVEIKDQVIDPRITCALSMLFEDKKLYEDWLDCPNPEFDGVAPRKLIEMGRSEIVAEYLEDVLLGHPH